MTILNNVVFLEIKKASGVYCIHCLTDNAWYVGKSTNVYLRKGSHLRELRSGVHTNGRLQKIFNVRGENDLSFFGLEYCGESTLMIREQFWYDHFRLTLNLTTLNYGETVFQVGNRANHPSRAGIKYGERKRCLAKTDEPQQTTKLWIKTIRKLALLRGLTNETAISIVDRLVTAELERVQKEQSECK